MIISLPLSSSLFALSWRLWTWRRIYSFPPQIRERTPLSFPFPSLLMHLSWIMALLYLSWLPSKMDYNAVFRRAVLILIILSSTKPLLLILRRSAFCSLSFPLSTPIYLPLSLSHSSLQSLFLYLSLSRVFSPLYPSKQGTYVCERVLYIKIELWDWVYWLQLVLLIWLAMFFVVHCM